MATVARKDRLAELIDEALRSTDRDPLGADAIPSLFLPDVLDSLSITALVSYIEDEWDIVIEDEELSPEIFESLDALDAFVATKLVAS
jgi:acyl carrier protein